MSLDQPPQDKMMTAPPAKKEFHFAGGGIWRNATILADTIEEAQKLWHATKQLISPPAEQSTPAPQPKSEETSNEA
jgi:hypothetical protein